MITIKKTKAALFALAALSITQFALGMGKAPKGEMPEAQNVTILLASEVEWEQLNPARGDQSPQAGTLWGDRKEGAVPTGFLAKFVDGFSSPPHIHNATYRAVVISGLVHNDDPDAAKMWMPVGSFWTQPKGEAHITAVKGTSNIALVEIDQGPYLVMHEDEAFDSGERPVNIDAANVVWLDASDANRVSGGAQVAFLWGSLEDGQSNGTFIKLPAGFKGTIQSQGTTFRAVVITGQPQYQLPKGAKTLDPGSYFGAKGAAVHPLASSATEESLLYIRTNGEYQIVASE